MSSFSSEQTARVSEVVARLAKAWSPIENPVMSSRGLFGLFPRVEGSIEEIFDRAGARVTVNYQSQTTRGGAANLRIVTGAIGHGVYFVARCTPSAVEGAFNIELDLAPEREGGDENAILSEAMLSICEDLLGEGLLTPDGLATFVQRQIRRGVNQRKAILASLASVMADELRTDAGEGASHY
ncbi:MAG TPA: hypothetical protein PLN91_00540 [Rhodanobacteraceae bacterium]|nr:hypothetical protein [Rhodanobacteraceae bacterium]